MCHIQAESHSESILLVSVARACFPALYEKRLLEIEEEKQGWELILPIFFFNDTLFPFSPLALHLFEPRYRVMINRIVNASRKFAYLPSFNGYQARVGDVGVVAELKHVEFLPDGRAHLQVPAALQLLHPAHLFLQLGAKDRARAVLQALTRAGRRARR